MVIGVNNLKEMLKSYYGFEVVVKDRFNENFLRTVRFNKKK